MILPKSLTTVTPFSKALALFIFISFPILGFWLGRWHEENKQSNSIQSQVNQLENEKRKLEEEIDLLIKDEAKVTRESTYIYTSGSGAKLGIDSSRFVNQQVNEREYYYKGSIITEQKLEVPAATEDLQFTVTVWQYRDTDRIKRTNANPPRVTFSFFSEDVPIKPEKISIEETEKNLYKNKDQIRMVRTINEDNLADYYRFFLPSPPIQVPLYVTVSAYDPYGYGAPLDKKDSKELTDFVDSISISAL